MNIALMAHDRKKELMVQFCIAYCGILAGHSICATNTTGRLVAERQVCRSHFISPETRAESADKLAYNELDLVLYFCDPSLTEGLASVSEVAASAIIQYAICQCRNGGSPVWVWRGDLDWRDIVNPSTRRTRLLIMRGHARLLYQEKVWKRCPRTLSGFMELLPGVRCCLTRWSKS